MRAQIPVMVLALSVGGCGTFANVTAPPGPHVGYRGMGPTACVPFGGVERSMVGGGLLLASGIGAPLGIVVFATDVPLSLAGDLVTLPIVYARQRPSVSGEHPPMDSTTLNVSPDRPQAESLPPAIPQAAPPTTKQPESRSP